MPSSSIYHCDIALILASEITNSVIQQKNIIMMVIIMITIKNIKDSFLSKVARTFLLWHYSICPSLEDLFAVLPLPWSRYAICRMDFPSFVLVLIRFKVNFCRTFATRTSSRLRMSLPIVNKWFDVNRGLKFLYLTS